jgi:hypothetical protein
VALALGMVSITATACGSGDSGSSTEQLPEKPKTGLGSLPGNAPQTKVIATQFPKPKTLPSAPPGAQKAIDAGRRACRGKTPTEVRDEFLQEAQASGLLNEGLEKMLEEMPKYEKQALTTPDFVAGQLAAGVYEATLPERLRRSGYQGCVYELAVQLRREIRQGKKKE